MKNLNYLRVFGTEFYEYIPKQFRRNSTTRVCLFEWLATWMIKTVIRFTCSLSTRLCTRMMSTSSHNEFAPVQWIKRGWKRSCGKYECWEKARRWHIVGVVTIGENPQGGVGGRFFNEQRTTNTYGQVANMEGIRGLHSSVGCWYTLLLLVVEIQRHTWKVLLSAQKEAWIMVTKEEIDALVEKTRGSCLMVQRMWRS
jgi:hypothetical protein